MLFAQEATPCLPVPETRTVNVSIPAGVDDTTNLRLASQGDAGPMGGPRGHLWVRLRVLPHESFKREGSDIHVTVRVLGCSALS